MEDKTAAISHMNTMVDSVRTNPVMAQIHEGKEPAQFFSILQRLIIFKMELKAAGSLKQY